MDLRLNKKCFLITAFTLAAIFVVGQEEMRPSDKDYKDKKQFEKFSKRRKAIACWQINQLKEGALVVRLKTNRLLINELLRKGDTLLAYEKEFETAGINTNIMTAFSDNYTFSKLYFIYSNSSDSLLGGIRQNIFVDKDLKISPSIIMNEKFYLLAERDLAYNSTIGFVKEDTAKFVKENGPAVKEMAVVVKNKYGHQLKSPFPYCFSDRLSVKQASLYVYEIPINGIQVPFNIKGLGSKDNKTFRYKGKSLTLFMPKYLTPEKISVSISNFNEALIQFYRANANIGIEKINPDIKPFLY